MSERYTIGQLASKADVPVSTVRYYERCGLLRPASRSGGNYRIFGREGLDQLRFVRSAQAAGFTLADIGGLLRFRHGAVAPCRDVQTLITSRLDQVNEEMAHLRHVQRALRKWRRVCCEAERAGRCAVLDGLAAVGKERVAPARGCS